MTARPTADGFLHSLIMGCVAGLTGGQVFLGVGLVRHGADLFTTAPTMGFAFWVILRSIAIYGLLGAAFGVVLASVLHGALSLVRRGRSLTGAITFGVILAGTALAYLSSWWQLEVLAGLPFEDAERTSGAMRHGAIALAIGAAWVIGAAVIQRVRQSVGPTPIRGLAAGLAGCVLLLISSQLVFRLQSPENEDPFYRPSQVVVIGLDALTFRVMSPMLRAGELPTFQRLIDEGAWGTFLTYGQASSPMVWTSMATGKRVRDHGINDFVIKRRGSYAAEPMKSFDWQARPVWEILNDFGHRVAVVDWLISFPPRELDGAMVTRLHMDEENRTYPPELNADVNEVLATVEDYGDEHRTRNFSRLDHMFATTDLLLERESPDFLATFEGVSDWVEHRYWKFYEPEAFDQALWGFGDAEVDQLRTLIPETYAHIDTKLGALIEKLDEDALLIVVSDHGQLAATQRPVWMRIDRVLEALGYATLSQGDDGKPIVDHAKSQAYASVETPWAPVIGVNVNRLGREPEGIVPDDQADQILRELVDGLQAVRFENGDPVFGAIYSTQGRDGETSADKADIVVNHSRFTRSDRYSQEPIRVGGASYRLNDFMEADTKISGGHDHQGVIFMHGKGVRRGPVGQLVASTAIQEIIWHLTDKIDAIDSLLPVLARLGMIERGSTLDVTPTVLHAFGLPIADDMAGRPLADLLITGQAVEQIATFENGERGVIRAADTESDEDMMKRLKALGYIN